VRKKFFVIIVKCNYLVYKNVSKGEMLKEFDTVVFKEDLNRVHRSIKTEFGGHLIEILARY